jgi:hypothetical protein
MYVRDRIGPVLSAHCGYTCQVPSSAQAFRESRGKRDEDLVHLRLERQCDVVLRAPQLPICSLMWPSHEVFQEV